MHYRISKNSSFAFCMSLCEVELSCFVSLAIRLRHSGRAPPLSYIWTTVCCMFRAPQQTEFARDYPNHDPPELLSVSVPVPLQVLKPIRKLAREWVML